MDNRKPKFRRRNYFIKKKFQVNFAFKFLAIVVIEAVLALGIFLYTSRGTLTTGYSGAELKIARTSDYFLPILFFSNLIIVAATCIVGILVLIVLSHRIAGPLYRIEKVLGDISKGDLTVRFKLREADQFIELENAVNELAKTMDMGMGDLKSGIVEISRLVSEAQDPGGSAIPANRDRDSLLKEISEKIHLLERKSNFYKTS